QQVRARRRRPAARERSLDDVGDPARAANRRHRMLQLAQLGRLPNDLERTSAVGEAMQIATLLEPFDEAMNARLGAKAQRAAHLLERGRHTMGLDEVANELQELPLALREHANPPVGLPDPSLSFVLWLFPHAVKAAMQKNCHPRVTLTPCLI